MAKKTGALKKKVVKVDPTGQAHVHSSFNNIIVTITNNTGQVTKTCPVFDSIISTKQGSGG